MDCILCATMANDSVELRHYSSRRHVMDRQILVRLLIKLVYLKWVTDCRDCRKKRGGLTFLQISPSITPIGFPSFAFVHLPCQAFFSCYIYFQEWSVGYFTL